MTPADLSRTVLHAVRRAVDEDVLRAPVPARVRVERTRPGGAGDYACAVALQLAGPAGLPARDVAEILRAALVPEPGIGRIDITGAGFLNFTLDASADAAARARVIRDVRARGLRYGWVAADGGQDIGQSHRFHHRREVRAAVVAHTVRRLVRTQGGRAAVHCAGAPDPDWDRLVTDFREDADGPRDEQAGSLELRPVPAGATAGALFGRLGRDATLWGLLRPAAHDSVPLGDGLLVQRESNPLFLVRYAHARARALTRGAALLGFDAARAFDGACAKDDAQVVEAPALHAALADHPRVLAAATHHHAPDRLVRHLETLAHAFFDFHDSCMPLPVGDEKPSAAHRSRLALAEAAGTVLAGGLSLLGISAPEHL